MRIYTPENQEIAREEFCRRMETMVSALRVPFSKETCDFLGKLSERLMGLPEARQYPQLMTLGFWLRPAALQQMKKAFFEKFRSNTIPVPRGIALHFPPMNVDTLFVYSWAISLLVGNVNVVRMPSKLSYLGSLLVQHIQTALAETGDPERNIFCSYPYEDDEASRCINSLADVRLIWGGDIKVDQISKFQMRPDAVSFHFPDRYSLLAIDINSYLCLKDAERNSLAERFFNDVYWFDQMGCGSPRVLYWIGGQAKELIEEDFFRRVAGVVKAKGYSNETGTVLEKIAYANRLAADGLIGRVQWYANEALVMPSDPSIDLRNRVQGGGVLASTHLTSLMDLLPLIQRKDQTLGYFGFSREELTSFAQQLTGRGLFRIVPVGEALQFESIWDGVDLTYSLVRQITIA